MVPTHLRPVLFMLLGFFVGQMIVSMVWWQMVLGIVFFSGAVVYGFYHALRAEIRWRRYEKQYRVSLTNPRTGEERLRWPR